MEKLPFLLANMAALGKYRMGGYGHMGSIGLFPAIQIFTAIFDTSFSLMQYVCKGRHTQADKMKLSLHFGTLSVPTSIGLRCTNKLHIARVPTKYFSAD